MPFEEGKSGNPNGRPIGAKSKKTLEWEQFGKNFLEGTMPRFAEIVEEWMDSDDNDLRYKAMGLTRDMIEYFKPKLSRAQLSSDEGTQIEFRIGYNQTPEKTEG